jgi:serine kinase of HPr protein (carbohydrate metabolism regulator)
MRNILGVEVPNIILPVSEGRDMVNLVETAAQQERLLNAGYDVVANLSQRLRGRAEKAKSMERNGKQ